MAVHLERYVSSATELDALDPRRLLASRVFRATESADTAAELRVAGAAFVRVRANALAELRRYRSARARRDQLQALARPVATLFAALQAVAPLHGSYQDTLPSFVQLVLLDLDPARQRLAAAAAPALARAGETFAEISRGYDDDSGSDSGGEEDVRGGPAGRPGGGAPRGEVRALGEALAQEVFVDCARSLHERHHLLYAFLAAVRSRPPES
jgi:hypothetical protein